MTLLRMKMMVWFPLWDSAWSPAHTWFSPSINAQSSSFPALQSLPYWSMSRAHWEMSWQLVFHGCGAPWKWEAALGYRYWELVGQAVKHSLMVIQWHSLDWVCTQRAWSALWDRDTEQLHRKFPTSCPVLPVTPSSLPVTPTSLPVASQYLSVPPQFPPSISQLGENWELLEDTGNYWEGTGSYWEGTESYWELQCSYKHTPLERIQTII